MSITCVLHARLGSGDSNKNSSHRGCVVFLFLFVWFFYQACTSVICILLLIIIARWVLFLHFNDVEMEA